MRRVRVSISSLFSVFMSPSLIVMRGEARPYLIFFSPQSATHPVSHVPTRQPLPRRVSTLKTPPFFLVIAARARALLSMTQTSEPGGLTTSTLAVLCLHS